MNAAPHTPLQLLKQQRDYLVMTVFVFAQHGDYKRAEQIVDGMRVLGERSEKVLISQAVLAFFSGNYLVALECLDDLDAGGNPGLDNESHRMRYFLRARCYYASGRQAEAKELAAKLASESSTLRRK